MFFIGYYGIKSIEKLVNRNPSLLEIVA